MAAQASENVETLTVADLDLSDLAWAKSQGTVRNLRDRRFDLYKTVWTDGGEVGRAADLAVGCGWAREE